MTEAQTIPPDVSRFGWPRPKRIDEFRRLRESVNSATTRIVFQGQNADLPIYRVPIELPKYRLENGRTVSLQAELLAKDNSIRSDIFSADPELWEAQKLQHNLLLQLCKRTELQKYFEDDTNLQRDPILLDEYGFVVNGNRRLSCWRELLFRDGKKYSHFQYIDIAILPHCDQKEIDRLEANLQIVTNIQEDYSWDARANMMLAKQKRDSFTSSDLAILYGMRESEVLELLDMRIYADDYLRSRGKENRWSEVEDNEYAFRELVKSRRKLEGRGAGAQELFKQSAYNLIEKDEDVPGRLYEAIPSLCEHIDQVREKLSKEFEVEPTLADGGLEAIFGGNEETEKTSIDIPLAKEIQKPENSQKVRQILVDVIETQKQFKKDSKIETFLLKCCAQANAQLAAGVKNGFRPETNTKGIATQLDEISKQIEQIRKFLADHVKH